MEDRAIAISASSLVIPAKAGIQSRPAPWIAACAGMTKAHSFPSAQAPRHGQLK